MSEKIIVHVDPDLEELVPGFLDNRRRDVGTVREALEKGDWESIRITGHSMKGAGGGYGFDAVTEYGARLEQAAIAGDPAAVREAVADLEDYLARVQVVYDA